MPRYRYRGTSADNNYTHARSKAVLAQGFDGNDTLMGNDRNDYLYGQNGNDRLDGKSGNDTLIGGSGNDILVGSIGNNYLSGDEGNDIIGGIALPLTGSGRPVSPNGPIPVGFDTLSGGLGSDTFVLGGTYTRSVATGATSSYICYLGAGYATITDWNQASDYLQLAGNSSTKSSEDGTPYSLRSGQWSGRSSTDTGLYLGNDLIAVFQDTTNVNLNTHVEWYRSFP